tara:strand:+ start:1883 stop:2713 length:831 start_codon:yes stop_codon:yes gene_type:complete
MSDLAASPGQMLQRIREQKGITIDEVASSLNLRITVVEAIEVDDYSGVILPVYARGYLRAYAKYLGLDEEIVSDNFTGTSQGGSSNAYRKSDRDSSSFRSYVSRHRHFILIMSILVIAMILSASSFSLFNNKSTVDKNGDLAVGLASSEVKVSSAPISDFKHESIEEQMTGNYLESGIHSQRADKNEFVHHRVLGSGSDLLTMDFSEDCWIELRTIDGQLLFADLMNESDHVSFGGGTPYKILLGNSPGVSMEFNGEAIVLHPHTRNNVSSIVLGQ